MKLNLAGICLFVLIIFLISCNKSPSYSSADLPPPIVLPNLMRLPPIKVKTNSLFRIEIDLLKDWMLSDHSPHRIGIYDYETNEELKTYSPQEILTRAIEYKLTTNKTLRVLASFYFCEHIHAMVCRIQSFDQALIPSEDGVGSTSFDIRP